jgi:hypothetical protein
VAITFPRADLFSGVGLLIDAFDLFERQELSRTADGVTRGKSFGSAIWRASVSTVPMHQSDALTFAAKLRSLDGVVNRFYLGDVRRPYPAAHADGNFTDSGVILSVHENNKAVAIDGLAGGLQLSVGDMLSFDYGATPSRALHQVMEAATASGSPTGPTAQFEVRPHLRPGIAASPMPEVTLKRPTGLFALEPNSIRMPRLDPILYSISFSAVQIL